MGSVINQRTIGTSIRAVGLGLHSGKKVRMTLKPGTPDSGIVFRRVDLSPAVDIPARAVAVTDTRLATTLGEGEGSVSTVEHLMSALAGLGVDNLLIELDQPEVPVMDGSSAPFVFLLQSAGVVEQSALKRFIKIDRPIEVRFEDKWARIDPWPGMRFDIEIDFDHVAVRNTRQQLSFDFARASFSKEISRARTFGFMRDFEALQARGLARGASLENAVALDTDRVVNLEGLRYADEFVRHKTLDAIGDLYLLGHGLLGRVSAYKSGHHLNNLLAREILAQAECWSWKSFGEPSEAPFAEAGELVFA